MARVQVLEETTTTNDADSDDWTLWFQWCRYLYDDGEIQHGYRFIWRRPKGEGGSLQAARGQARIPSVRVLEELVEKAKNEGWGNHDGDNDRGDIEAAAERLRRAGLIVDIQSGYVGWPNKEAAEKGRLTPQMVKDERLVRGRIRDELTDDSGLPVAEWSAGARK